MDNNLSAGDVVHVRENEHSKVDLLLVCLYPATGTSRNLLASGARRFEKSLNLVCPENRLPVRISRKDRLALLQLAVNVQPLHGLNFFLDSPVPLLFGKRGNYLFCLLRVVDLSSDIGTVNVRVSARRTQQVVDEFKTDAHCQLFLLDFVCSHFFSFLFEQIVKTLD